jgi:hypothetical protein
MNKEHLEIQQIKLAYQKKTKKIKTVKVKCKSRDLIAEAEYEIAHGSKSSRKTPNMESK